IVMKRCWRNGGRIAGTIRMAIAYAAMSNARTVMILQPIRRITVHLREPRPAGSVAEPPAQPVAADRETSRLAPQSPARESVATRTRAAGAGPGNLPPDG